MKLITREQIIEHGKAKGIISEESPETANTIALSAADKVLETSVPFRRAKKERLAKVEE